MNEPLIVWGYFLSRPGGCYDLQGLFDSQDAARSAVVTNIDGFGWYETTTGRHWMHPDGVVIRISPVEVGRMRDHRDSDSADDTAALAALWERIKHNFDHGDSMV